MKTIISTLILSSYLIILSTVVTRGQPGSLDPAFGVGGIVITDVGGLDDYGNSVAIQSDGKIVLAGHINIATYQDYLYDFALVRYNPDGTLDSTFSSDGIAVLDMGFGNYSYFRGSSVAIDSSGKILLAGFWGPGAGYIASTLVRCNGDGTLDSTFAGDGLAITEFGGYDDRALSVALQSNGKIVVAGYSAGDVGAESVMAVARYDDDGSLDYYFGSAGIVTTTFFSGGVCHGNSVAIQSDDKIVVAGNSDSSDASDYYFDDADFALARYNPDGSLDITFSTDGKVATDFLNSSSDGGGSVAIQSDGKIVVGGGSGGNFALARYNSDGSLDSTFDADGKVTTDFGFGSGGSSLAIQGDSKIVLAGSCNGSFALARYNSDGSSDSTFGTGGKLLTTIEDHCSGNSVAIQGDGKIVVAGISNDGSSYDLANNFALARYDVGFGVGIPENIDGRIPLTVYPNPAKDHATIQFTLPQASHVYVKVYDVRGKEIEILLNDDMEKGGYSLQLITNQFSKGVYLVEMISDSGMENQKLVVQ